MSQSTKEQKEIIQGEIMDKECLLSAASDTIRFWEQKVIDSEYALNDFLEQKSMIQFKVEIELGARDDLKNEAQRKAYKATRYNDLGLSNLNYRIFTAIKSLAEDKAELNLYKREYQILLGKESFSSI